MDLKKLFYAEGLIYELGKGIVILVIILILIQTFIGTIFVVRGGSMEPNFTSGEFIIADKIDYILNQPKRGDVVVIKFPGDPDRQKYIKRIIGLPGEKLEIVNGKTYINDRHLVESYLPIQVITGPNKIISLGSDEYFLMGDNRINSSDSRYWGTVIKRDFIGKAVFRLTPFDKAGFITKTYYQ